jgi:uncharacterized repeat protein (TIGR03806 family)
MNFMKGFVSTRCKKRARLRKPFFSLFASVLFVSELLVSAAGLFTAGTALAQSAPTEQDFVRTTVADGMDLPSEFQISEDGRAFVIGKCGAFYGWNLDSGVATQTSTLPDVRCEWEDGALSLALDPNFTQNNWIYFQYTSPGSITQVSRYTVNASNGLDLNSRTDIIQWTTGNEAHGHMGGSMLFDNDGNLIITTGDNMAAGGYYTDAAQASSGNTNDLRGKVIRIKSGTNGGYSVPAGNLFGAGDSLHRPEIYGMGFRNPYRINIDPLTGYLYVGDIGPDASTASAEGPMGMDEINEISQASNFGWPWILGFNEPYAGFDPFNLVNNYHLNTGATNIPDASPAMWTVFHRGTMVGPVYRLDSSINHEYKLPAYFDGKLIFWDFNSSKFFTIDMAGDRTQHSDFPLPSQGIDGAIDVELDPRTHQLYVLQWGTGCCGKEPYGNGKLYRFDYVGGGTLGQNVALGGIATASSTAGSNGPSMAIDGNESTRWESASSDPQTFELDLQQGTTIASIVIKWEAAFSSAYTIEASADGSSWTQLVSVSGGSGGIERHLINSQNSYHYLRFTGTARGTGYGHSFWEFEVYKGDTVEPCPNGCYLNMPATLDANFTDVPQLLSQTGTFADTANLVPVDRLIPFKPNTALWSDRALKMRWMSLPDGATVNWHETADWTWPTGSVAVKHFELPLDADGNMRRLETRLLVMQANGQVYGVTYRWNSAQTDAELLTTDVQDTFTITNADGTTWQQTWTYPSPQQCLACHTQESAQFLGLSTRQLNGDYDYPGLGVQNQLAQWNNLSLFSPSFNNANIGSFDQMAAINDTSASLEHRVKSYLDTNCAHCHGTGNGGSQWNARFNTPLAQMLIVDEPTTGIRDYNNYYGIVNALVVESGNPHESILYIRDKSVNPDDRMPPLARALEHPEYIQVLEQWINSLSGSSNPIVQLPVVATTSSSVEGSHAAANATDGDPSTRWSSEFADPQWIQLDLGEVYSIDSIELNWEAAYGSDYVIEGSQDGTNWETVVTQTGGTGGVETFSNLSGQYRYIRLTGTARGTAYGYSLWEFTVHGSTEAPVPNINVVSPTAGQQFDEGQSVSLHVSVSDSSWFANGGSYNYVLNGGSAVNVTSATPVNLGALNAQTHSVVVRLVDTNGQIVGDPGSVSFTVNPASTGPAWLSLNKPVTVSSVEGSNVGANAVDGDSSTRWSSEFADPQWIQVDLQDTYAISEIRLSWEAAYGSDYVIEGSTDGTNWSQLALRSGGTGGAEIFSDLSGNYRYVRLTGTARGTSWGYSLWEFEVWGGNAATVPDMSIVTPAAGQQYEQGQNVSLQVSVSDSNWFSNGGGFQYALDGGAWVQSTSNPATITAPAVGSHNLSVQLVDSSGQAVGTTDSTSFTVNQTSTSGLLSQNQPVTASSNEGGLVGSNAVDGDLTTRWGSEFADNQWIQIDLGASSTISRIVLEWEGAYGSSYIVETSNDGTNWSQIYSTTTGDGGTDDLSVSGSGRYVRLTGLQRATAYGFSLWEFQVYGVTEDQPAPQISLVAPSSGATYLETENVNLQVSVNDPNWFSSGNSYQYSLDGGAPVEVTHANGVNLGTLAVGPHSISVNLLNASNQVVGNTASASFQVNATGGDASAPAPAVLTPVGAESSSGTAAYAIDGDTTSRWESAFSDPQWIQLDFGQSIYFTEVTLNWEAAYARTFEVQVSADGSTWQSAYSTTNGPGGVQTIALNGEQGRYIRMYGTARATGYGYSLWEFTVEGVPATADVPLLNVVSPADGAELPENQSVQLDVDVTDSGWFANGGSYNYYLDNGAATRVYNGNAVDLGVLPTGKHTLRLSLVDSNGAEVSVPRNLTFRVSCGSNCPNVLVFSKTSGFRHGSIPAGIAMVEQIGAENGYTVTASEDAGLFTDANLAQYDTIVFMNTTGDIFTDSQKAAFRAYIENGGGYVGTHSAADTEHSWTWYTDTLLGGAEFIHHGDGIPEARVEIEQPSHPLVNHIGSEWILADEWYFWESNPRGVGNIQVLGNLDRASYASNYPVEDHPVIFTNTLGTGRVFYTAIGHVDGNFSDPHMVEMMRKAIEWTSGN